MIQDELLSIYLYSEWADRRVLESLRTLSPEQYRTELGGGWASPRATFVHLAGATDAWAKRFGGADATVLPKEDELPELDDAGRLLLDAHQRLQAFVRSVSPERAAGPFTWKNLQGRERTAPFWAVLRHAVNHGTYHRGQLSSMVRRLGGKPAPTDMVVWGIEQWESAS